MRLAILAVLAFLLSLPVEGRPQERPSVQRTTEANPPERSKHNQAAHQRDAAGDEAARIEVAERKKREDEAQRAKDERQKRIEDATLEAAKDSADANKQMARWAKWAVFVAFFQLLM